MHLIIYISDYTKTAAELSQHLEDICRISKEQNPKFGITGLLFYHNGNFLQVIEGEKANLESLMSALERDPRHKNITRVIDSEVFERGFSDWNMDAFNLNASDSISREALAEYSKAFSKQCNMDTFAFIETLKSMQSDENLKEIILG
ncbi:MAG: BLUF domain-containing protein [Opitutaceae bacterium]